MEKIRRLKYVFAGMAIILFGNSFLIKTKLIIATPDQQAATGLALLIISLLFWAVDK